MMYRKAYYWIRKYAMVIRISLANSMEYRANFFANTTLTVFSHTAVQMFLWHAIYQSSGTDAIGGYTQTQMLTYIACANVCLTLTRINRGGWAVAGEIRDGQLSKYLLRPISLSVYMVAQAIAERLVAFLLIMVPALAIGIPMMNSAAVSLSLEGSLIAIPILFIGFLMNVYMTLTLSYFAFWTDEIWTFLVVKDISLWILTGSMFPLNKLSPALASASDLLPFQFLSYIPAELMTGRIPMQAAPLLAFKAVIWLIILILINNAMWRIGLRRFGAYGG